MFDKRKYNVCISDCLERENKPYKWGYKNKTYEWDSLVGNITCQCEYCETEQLINIIMGLLKKKEKLHIHY